jgi:hypothetical protein
MELPLFMDTVHKKSQSLIIPMLIALSLSRQEGSNHPHRLNSVLTQELQ